jgi:hypothetical protein
MDVKGLVQLNQRLERIEEALMAGGFFPVPSFLKG